MSCFSALTSPLLHLRLLLRIITLQLGIVRPRWLSRPRSNITQPATEYESVFRGWYETNWFVDCWDGKERATNISSTDKMSFRLTVAPHRHGQGMKPTYMPTATVTVSSFRCRLQLKIGCARCSPIWEDRILVKVNRSGWMELQKNNGPNEYPCCGYSLE